MRRHNMLSCVQMASKIWFGVTQDLSTFRLINIDIVCIIKCG